MTVKELITSLLDAPADSTVRIVLEKPQLVGEDYHKALVVWWDDERAVTYIGDSV